LLDTAARLFWEKGYAATTTREIAAVVGIQQASLYYHVSSKEELLHQLCVSALERLAADVRAALEESHAPLERIRILIRAHLATLLRHQIRHVTMLTGMQALSKSHLAEVLALRKSYAAMVHAVVAEGQQAGAIRRDIPAQYLYLALLNLVNWPVVWFRRDEALAAGELADLFAPIFLEGAAAKRLERELPDFEVHLRRTASKHQKSAADTSQRLVDAAAALFAIKGYGATSTREIAAALGIQKASLYYHIGSKEELLFAICKTSLDRIRSDVETAIAGLSDPIERIGALVRAHLESMLRDQEKHSVALAEMHLLSAERFAEVRLLRDAYENLVRSALQEAQEAGALRADIPVKFLCLALLGLMNRVEVWYRRSGPLSPGQLGQMLAALFLTGAAVSRG
jgi:AcrR family transcriptional regulator